MGFKSPNRFLSSLIVKIQLYCIYEVPKYRYSFENGENRKAQVPPLLSSHRGITELLSPKLKMFMFFLLQNDVFHANNASLSLTVWGRGSDRSGHRRLGQARARRPEGDGVALFAWPTPPGRAAANQREDVGYRVGKRGSCRDGEEWIMPRAEKLTISYLELCSYNSNLLNKCG